MIVTPTGNNHVISKVVLIISSDTGNKSELVFQLTYLTRNVNKDILIVTGRYSLNTKIKHYT